ncbi:unnamed protein product [Prunus armeniaca]
MSRCLAISHNDDHVPIAVSVTLFEAKFLCKGTRVIASKGKEITNWKLHQIFPYCSCGIIAGMVGSLLGPGGGFILGPLFLELGIPPLDRIKELYAILLVMQPILMLGIGIGVAFNVLFTEWMALLSRPGPFLNPKHNTQPLFFFNLIVVSLSLSLSPHTTIVILSQNLEFQNGLFFLLGPSARLAPPSARLGRLAPA